MTSSRVFTSFVVSISACFSSLASKLVVSSRFSESIAFSPSFNKFWSSLSLSPCFFSLSPSLGVFCLLGIFLYKNSSLAVFFSRSVRTTSCSLPINLFSSSLSLEFSSTMKLEKFVQLFLSFFVIKPR